jgi:hypothetical protein
MCLCSFAWAANHDVTISGTSFVPSELTINAGDTVTWTWNTGLEHNVRADDSSFTSGNPSTTGSFQQLFDSPGTVGYHCQPHRAVGMTGTITVQAEQPPFYINPGLNDAWWFGTKGQGFLFTVLPDIKAVFLAWFTFDTERPPEDISAILGDPGQRWFTALGAYEPGNTLSLEIELTEGMIFDSPLPEKQQTPGYGTMTMTFSDCENATLTYEFTDGQVAPGSYEITRVAPDPANIALCEALNAELQSQP